MIQAPTFDYIPPESVSYFIMDTYAIRVLRDVFLTISVSNSGFAYHPTYIHRLLADYYAPDDYYLAEGA